MKEIKYFWTEHKSKVEEATDIEKLAVMSNVKTKGHLKWDKNMAKAKKEGNSNKPRGRPPSYKWQCRFC